MSRTSCRLSQRVSPVNNGGIEKVTIFACDTRSLRITTKYKLRGARNKHIRIVNHVCVEILSRFHSLVDFNEMCRSVDELVFFVLRLQSSCSAVHHHHSITTIIDFVAAVIIVDLIIIRINKASLCEHARMGMRYNYNIIYIALEY